MRIPPLSSTFRAIPQASRVLLSSDPRGWSQRDLGQRSLPPQKRPPQAPSAAATTSTSRQRRLHLPKTNPEPWEANTTTSQARIASGVSSSYGSLNMLLTRLLVDNKAAQSATSYLISETEDIRLPPPLRTRRSNQRLLDLPRRPSGPLHRRRCPTSRSTQSRSKSTSRKEVESPNISSISENQGT